MNDTQIIEMTSVSAPPPPLTTSPTLSPILQNKVLERGEIYNLLLRRDVWESKRSDDIEIIGLEGCLDMFGLDGNAAG